MNFYIFSQPNLLDRVHFSGLAKSLGQPSNGGLPVVLLSPQVQHPVAGVPILDCRRVLPVQVVEMIRIESEEFSDILPTFSDGIGDRLEFRIVDYPVGV